MSNNFPRRILDFGLKHSTKVIQMIPSAKLNGRNPIESLTVKTPDISDYVDFDFYDFLWHHTGRHPSVSKEH